MRILQNTLTPIKQRWDDPAGPEAAGGMAPEPSHLYVSSVEGTIKVQLEDVDFSDNALAFIDQLDMEMPDDIMVNQWRIVRSDGDTITLSVQDFEEL
jgi:hypothetical protein